MTGREWMNFARATLVAIPVCLTAVPLAANEPVRIVRTSGGIVVDGRLDEPVWRDATRLETWFETRPGDNIEPRVRNVGYLAYDDQYFYAGFEFFDPDPARIVAPYADRDNVASATDYGGIVLDTNNDRRSALLLLANPRGIQYDAISNDASGEDSAPDYFWDSAATILEDRWVLEIRIPFKSLRYSSDEIQEWGIMLYRNWPRDRRYQMFTTRLPRNVNCFICNRAPLVGLEGLPDASGLVLAPYVTANQLSTPTDGLGSSLESGDADVDGGLDVKWTPNANTAIDATINPDFSQIESDVAIITTNERFAISLPEKRPFFLESIDLFSTPITAVYTRSISDPDWGARATGTFGDTSYTALLAKDAGGGLVIMSGPNNSGVAVHDFEALDFVGRVRHDIGQSFLSLLATAREIDGGGYNRVLGPDFEWKLSDQDRLSGQLLWSESRTPDRPDLTPEWNGQSLSGHGAKGQWSHGGEKWDWTAQYIDIANDFRVDLGFTPQVGVREGFLDVGRTFYPKGFFSRVRLFTFGDYTGGRNGDLIFSGLSPGIGMDGRWNSFWRFSVQNFKIRAGDVTLPRTQFHYTFQMSPNRLFNRIILEGWIGEEIDFAHARVGDGARVSLDAVIRPNDHLELVFDTDYRYLDIDGGRLFDAEVERLKATWTFNQRSFVRLIGQHVRTDRNPELHDFPVEPSTGAVTLSALYAFKLNWQTVFFLGYGDTAVLTGDDDFETAERSVFLKISYAWQM
jgi:hypothetical protein